jgi:hypothetical protein
MLPWWARPLPGHARNAPGAGVPKGLERSKHGKLVTSLAVFDTYRAELSDMALRCA